jgi:Ca2+-binding RTX toxin-like protein
VYWANCHHSAKSERSNQSVGAASEHRCVKIDYVLALALKTVGTSYRQINYSPNCQLSRKQVVPTIIGTANSDTIVPEFSSFGVTGGVIAPINTAEADVVDGGAGADIMDAGDGDDIYFVDNVGDFVAEQFNDSFGGVDEIRSTVSYSINFADFDNRGFGIENITLLGFDNINATGNSNNNVLVGNGGANILNGLGGDDTFLGGSGNDSYDGGEGSDTIDYSSLGQRVTLKSQGVIEKAGGLGTDTIAGVELIIGTLGKSNLIDGSVAGPQATSFDINLDTNNLTVNGIPGIGSSSFFVQNFTDVRGTSNSDTIIGNGALNFFLGTAGDDSYDGLGGFDTIDYGALGTAVTLKSQGIIEKGALGTDTIAGMERIVGAAGQINVIDGFTGSPQPTSFEIDLDGSLLLVKNIPGIGDQAFFIKNFVNVRGTTNDDDITGNNLANNINGGGGNDTINGGGGNDTLIGGAGNDSYGFDTDLVLGADTLDEAGGGVDTLNFSATTTRSVRVNLGLATSQVVNAGLRLTLGSTTTFENVIGGGLADTLTGNNLANSLNGGGGNDTINGGGGDDTLIGGAGNDSYVFDTDLALGADTLDEAGGGVDTLNFSATTTRSVAVNLGLATSQVVNGGLSLTLGSITTFENVIGGGLADTLTGNNLANNLNGGGGNDTINGGSGKDTINGGGGNDTLIGGVGADRFRFDTPLNATTNRDVISDFSIAQRDTIELENAVFTALTTTGTLAAPAFFIGAAATNANQRILYNSATGGLLYDQDGSGAIGSIAFARLTSGLALNNTFFTIT